MHRASNIGRWQWIAPFVFRSVKNRKYLPQPPRTDSRWSGKQMTIHLATANRLNRLSFRGPRAPSFV